MLDAGHRSGLPLESFLHARIVEVLRTDELHGDVTPKLLVVGGEDHAHAALPDHPQEAVTVEQAVRQRPGRFEPRPSAAQRAATWS